MKQTSTKLQQIEELLGYGPKKMAHLGEISRTTYHRYKSGKSLPGSKFLFNLLQNEDQINANWLIKDEGEPLQGEGLAEQQLELPTYKMDGQDRRGSTLNQREWEEDYQIVSFDSLFVNKIMGLESYKLIGLFVNGGSSDNIFQDGSLVVIDLYQKSYKFDTYYLVRVGDSYRIYLIQRISGQKLLILGGNSHTKPITYRLDAENPEIEIKGRVVWVGKRY